MDIQYIQSAEGNKLAYVYTPGQGPLVVFLGGYRSDMNGTKACYLETHCKARGQAFLRLDYSGHGLSGGAFEDGTIRVWARDAQAVIEHVRPPEMPVLLVGSSMGGWIALLTALSGMFPVAGVIGIAAAPDFTEDIYRRLDDTQKADLDRRGYAMVPNDYSDEPYRFTKAFYEDAKKALILTQPQEVLFPVMLFQGMQDKDVLPETAETIRSVFGEPVQITYIEDGDHRLSRPEDLSRINAAVVSMAGL